MDMVLTIKATNVPASLEHKTRSEEILELPKYLNVSASATEGLFLLNVGMTTPSPDNTRHPWLKLDAGGSPLGLFVYVNGEWIRVPSA